MKDKKLLLIFAMDVVQDFLNNHVNPDDPMNKEAEEHALNHLLKGETAGTDIVYECRDIQVGKMEN